MKRRREHRGPRLRGLTYVICGVFLFDLSLARGEAPHPVFLGRPAFQAYTDRDGLPQNVVECITFDHRGFLWIGTQNGAAYYDGRTWTALNMPNRNISNYVFAILAASDGSMWFGTQQAGLCRLKDGKWDIFTAANSGLPNDEVRCLLEVPGVAGEPAIWIGTGGGGIAVYQAGRWARFNSANAARLSVGTLQHLGRHHRRRPVAL
jgi:hypothetical protein